MNIDTRVLLAVCALSMCLGAAFVRAQDVIVPETSGPSDSQTTMALQMMLAQSKARSAAMDRKGGHEEGVWDWNLAGLYQNASSTPDGAQVVVDNALMSYIHESAHAQSAAQVTQAIGESDLQLRLLQAEQNERIIGLLEKISANIPAPSASEAPEKK